MNEEILKELKIVVEQAVRPVRATIARKRRMREELLAHLTAIFEEEATKLSNETLALELAKQRFGNPRELTGQLQQAVPWWNRSCSILENMGYRPNESAWHLALRHFFVMLPIYLLWLPTWIEVREGLPNPNLIPSEALYNVILVLVGAVIVLALFNVILSIVLAPLLFKIGPALAAKCWKHILLVVLCIFALLCSFILPPFFTGVAILFTLMVRQAVKEQRYQSDWAQPAQ